jgi:hypothetical protein
VSGTECLLPAVARQPSGNACVVAINEVHKRLDNLAEHDRTRFDWSSDGSAFSSLDAG